MLSKGRGVSLNLCRFENRPSGRATARIPNTSCPVADDQYYGVAELLKFTEFSEHDRETKMDVRSRRVNAELDSQGPTLVSSLNQPRLEPALR